MKIDFSKMCGSGNDFILIDNRAGMIDSNQALFAKKVCARKYSVGADGLILLEDSEVADFKWRFFNADGSEAEMCGNGGRCAARFAYLKNIAPLSLTFETLAGIIRAEVRGRMVKLALPSPVDISTGLELIIEGENLAIDTINTGVPHAVVFVDSLEDYEVVKIGREIRRHRNFQPQGTNVNFVVRKGGSNLSIRTYERGVENETLACGTGSVAAALMSARKGMVESPVAVDNKGGEILTVSFRKEGGSFEEVFLEGYTNIIYEGFLGEDACLESVS